jgi:hypothetical protein
VNDQSTNPYAPPQAPPEKVTSLPDSDMGRAVRTGVLLLIAAVGPLALISAYLWLSRWPIRWFVAESDIAFSLISVGVGVVCITKLPIHAVGRLVLACLYVPIALFLLVLYALYFVGFMFDDWL